jgi:IPT/TIG domain
MAATFTYISDLRVIGVMYAFGPVAGGQGVAIAGEGFVSGATVTFGGVAATGITVQSTQLIYATTPAHAAGSVGVTVTNPDGTSATLSAGYLYQTADPDFIASSLSGLRRPQAIQINHSLGQPKTCTLTTEVEPVGEQECQISVFGKVLFDGVIQFSEMRSEGDPLTQVWDVELTDNTAKLDYRRPVGVYYNTSVTTIVTNLVTGYAPGFRLHVTTGLATISIKFKGNDTFSQCLDALAKFVNGHWYIEGIDLWFYTTDPGNNNPDSLTELNTDLLTEPEPKLSMNYRSIRNRIHLRGRGGVTAQVDDVTSQQTYRVREFFIEDTNIRTRSGLISRGNVELQNFAFPIPQLTYQTRDLKTGVGKYITANLTNPPITGTYLIQSVTIDQIHEADELKPRFSVVASPVRFEFMDVVRSTLARADRNVIPELAGDVETDDETGEIKIPVGTVTHDQLAGCIPPDKLNPSGVTAGTYGAAATVPVITVSPSGQVTVATGQSIQIGTSQVTGLDTTLAGVELTARKNQPSGYMGLTAGSKPAIPIALNDLSDVEIGVPAQGHTLVYDAATSQFKNATGQAGLARETLTFTLGTLPAESVVEGSLDLTWHTALLLELRCLQDLVLTLYASAERKAYDPRTFPSEADPPSGMGILGEFAFDPDTEEVSIAPSVSLHNDEVDSTLLYYRAYNPLVTPAVVSIDMTIVGLE